MSDVKKKEEEKVPVLKRQRVSVDLDLLNNVIALLESMPYIKVSDILGALVKDAEVIK